MAEQRAMAAISNAVNLLQSDSDDDDFSRVVQQTRRSFRRAASSSGRKKKDLWKKKILLLKRANADFFPTTSEIEFLSASGYGYAKEEVAINRQWQMAELEEYICSIFPEAPLRLTGFKFCICNRQRRIIKLDANSIQTAEQLKEAAGQGVLIIMPNRDLPDSATTNIVPARREERETNSTITPERSANARVRRNVHIRGNSRIQYNNIDVASTSRVRVDATASIQSTTPGTTVTVGNVILSSDEEIDTDDIGIPIISNEDTMPTLLFNRDNVVQEMFEHYKDENLPTQRPQIIFEHETGADCGGLTKEVYTIFFSKIEESYFAGENVLIPFLPLHRQRRELQKYVTIGTILDHCVCLTRSLPIRFSKSFLLKLGNADAIISDEILLDDFLKYVTVHEANFLKKGLNDFNQLDKIERNDLISFFTCYKLYENPSPTEFCEQILSIAKENLIVKPTNLIDEIRKGIHPLRYEIFWSKLNLKIVKKLLSYQKLTPEKVIEIIRPFKADLTNEEQNILYYLHMYIRSLSCDALQQLVFFITGSYTLPDEIIITFTTISGLMIRPISHTCSNTLELSICYNTYQEFKRNLNIYLGSEYSYQYTQL